MAVEGTRMVGVGQGGSQEGWEWQGGDSIRIATRDMVVTVLPLDMGLLRGKVCPDTQWNLRGLIPTTLRT